MVPEITQFIRGLQATMENVILPGLSDPFAQEQAAIVLASLGHLAAVHDKQFHYELTENRMYKTLLGETVALFDAETDLAPALASGARAAAEHLQTKDRPGDHSHLRSYAFLRESNEIMKELTGEFVRQQAGMTPSLSRAFRAILDPFLTETARRERSWTKLLGFEIAPAEVPDLDELLYDGDRLRPVAGGA